MAGLASLGMDLSVEDGSDGALLWVGWVAGHVGACGCGGGGLTTLIVGMRVIFPFRFQGMTGLSIRPTP